MAYIRIGEGGSLLPQENNQRREQPPQPPPRALEVAIVVLPVIGFLGALYYKCKEPIYLGATCISASTLLFSLLAANDDE